jgi:hypothetical protein
MSYINLLPNVFTSNPFPVLNNPENNSPVDNNYTTSSALNLKADESILSLVSPGSYKLFEGDNISDMNSKNALSQTKETLLTFLFFSRENLCNLQSLIRYKVYQEIHYTISNVSFIELLNIMRNVFYDYNLHPPIIRKDMSINEKIITFKKYKNEVERLNQIVMGFVLPSVVSAVTGYLYYLKDSSQVAVKDFNPLFTSSKGEVEYRSITATLVGPNVL